MTGKKILKLQEMERKRIAEELHDTIVQDMVHLSQQLELVLYYMDGDMAQAKLEAAMAKKQIKRMIGSMRETIYDLRPIVFDDIGWGGAFRHLRDKLSKQNPELNIVFDIDEIDTSDGVTAISIYRIVCEGCQNILKHSKAQNAAVSVKRSGKFIKIQIYDDGIGLEHESTYTLDAQDHHFGLKFMREKAESLFGHMDISSNTSGTILNIQIPVSNL